MFWFFVFLNIWFWAGHVLVKESVWWKFNPLKLRKEGVIKVKDLLGFIVIIPAATMGTVMEKVLNLSIAKVDEFLEIELSNHRERK